MKQISAFSVIFILAAVLFVLARSNPDPWSNEEVANLTVGLNEAAAIGVPHGFLMSKDMRSTNLVLLEKVESGALLNEIETKSYRYLFQKTLQDSQNFLSRFDAELTIIPDHAMDINNNVQTMGIAHLHDHHDTSARRNFAGLLQSLEQFDQAKTSFGRIRFANAAQKDLVDLISHMGVAPHTVSVPYVPPEFPWANAELGQIFEEMMKAFKQAQFSSINSPAYWVAIDQALAQYSELILKVQQHVTDRTSAWERRIAGRFLATQTLAPPVDLERALRRK
jgi:hypothetical protein